MIGAMGSTVGALLQQRAAEQAAVMQVRWNAGLCVSNCRNVSQLSSIKGARLSDTLAFNRYGDLPKMETAVVPTENCRNCGAPRCSAGCSYCGTP